MAVDSSPILPGRLGTLGMTLRDDPRADPRMIAAMVPDVFDTTVRDIAGFAASL